ncbi:MAG TPA: histidine kinase [Chitinophagaceae bacterium]|nr:histidine kinase [Chitinophagaceae bacterium]
MGKINKILLIVFVLLVVTKGSSLFGQTRQLDSLKLIYKQSVSQKEKRITALKICEQFNSLSADSLQYYVRIGLALSDKNSAEYFRFKNFYCYYYLKNSKATESNLYLDTLLNEISAFKNFESIRLEILYNKAISLIRDNLYKVGMDTALNLLKASEKIKDSLSVMKSYSALGLANMELENEVEAINWLSKGTRYTKNEILLANVNSLFLNLASCYKVREQYDTALLVINKGLIFTQKLENLTNEANALNIRAGIYSKLKKMDLAQKDLEDALVIRKKVGDTHYMVADMGVLSFFYTFNNQPLKGIDIAQQGIVLAQQTGNIYKLIYLKKGLANAYHGAKQYEKAYDMAFDIMQMKDSLYEHNTEKAIAELEAKYELKKKENIIILQENKLIRSRYTLYVALILLGLGTILAYLIYRNYKHIQQGKMEKALAEEKIHSMKAIQQAEEKERKRIAADLHDNLGSYAAAISSNVRYLKEMSDDKNESIVAQLDENAKGIVTQLSDSIWVLKNEQLSITKLADRFKAWAQRIIQNYPHVKYFYEEDISNDIELTPAKILNIFLILKECLNNSLKHSNCNEIKIYFSSNDDIVIRIEDNGKGFESNIVNRGNGIENIKYRAKECNLQVNWLTLKDKGTQVTLSSTTTN